MSNTNSDPFDGIISDLSSMASNNAMEDVQAQARKEARLMDIAVKGFMNLFADKAIDTAKAPSLAQYTPIYAPYSTKYAAKKAELAPDKGWFGFSGKLEQDIVGLTSQTTNLMGHSSTWLELRNSGLNEGFSLTPSGRVRGPKGKFASFREGFKDFQIIVNHQPFSKLQGGFKPKDLEHEVFYNTQREVYNKLVNTGGPNNKYRGVFYAFTSWWVDVYLRNLIKAS